MGNAIVSGVVHCVRLFAACSQVPPYCKHVVCGMPGWLSREAWCLTRHCVRCCVRGPVSVRCVRLCPAVSGAPL
eukprot:11193375-Alexandrium_andersonii.AAC.1